LGAPQELGLEGGPVVLDDRLSAVGPAFLAGHPAADTSARAVEQSVNLDLDDEFDWPWLYAVEVGHRNLTDRQAREMREYLDRAASLCATISMATKSGAFSSPA
jgi:hypothetical protein